MFLWWLKEEIGKASDCQGPVTGFHGRVEIGKNKAVNQNVKQKRGHENGHSGLTLLYQISFTYFSRRISHPSLSCFLLQSLTPLASG